MIADTLVAADSEYLSAVSASRVVVTERNGFRISWRIWGDGPALVLMHGGFGSWTHWIRNVLPLSRDYCVIAPDLPGLGDSGPVAEGTTSEDMGRALVEGFEEIRSDRSVHGLVGFSFGSVIAGRFAAACRGSLKHFILVGASALGVPRTPPREEMKRWRQLESMEELLQAHRHNLSIHMIHDPAKIDDLAVSLQYENTRRARFNSRPVSRSSDLADALAETDARLSAIWGEYDATAIGGLDQRHALLKRYDPELNFVIIPGAGHWVAYEAAEAFNRTVLSALSGKR